MNRREFLKAGAAGAAACVIPLSIPRDAIAGVLFGTPKEINLDNLCDISLKLLNKQLRRKVVVSKGDASKGKGWNQKHVSFAYDTRMAELPLSEFVDINIEPAIKLLSDAILQDAKRGRVVVGRLAQSEGTNEVIGELNNVSLRLIKAYNIKWDEVQLRIDIIYAT